MMHMLYELFPTTLPHQTTYCAYIALISISRTCVTFTIKHYPSIRSVV